ncbi:MAG: hypothetical protein ABSF95_06655 [Verrucomicrobiota bacterium]|jgi:hypothetical protein
MTNSLALPLAALFGLLAVALWQQCSTINHLSLRFVLDPARRLGA